MMIESKICDFKQTDDHTRLYFEVIDEETKVPEIHPNYPKDGKYLLYIRAYANGYNSGLFVPFSERNAKPLENPQEFVGKKILVDKKIKIVKLKNSQLWFPNIYSIEGKILIRLKHKDERKRKRK